MTAELAQQLESTLFATEAEVESTVGFLDATSPKLNKAILQIHQSSSKSWVGWHSRLYFRGFDTPRLEEDFSPEWGGIDGVPSGWLQRSSDEVADAALELSGLDVTWDDVAENIGKLKTSVIACRDDVLLLLPDAPVGRLQKILNDIEKLQLSGLQSSYFSKVTPSRVMSRDSSAFSQGVQRPPHVYYQAAVFEAVYLVKNAKELLRLVSLVIKMAKGGGIVSGDVTSVAVPATCYVDTGLIVAIEQKNITTVWSLDKLLQLVRELNDNHDRNNSYGCHVLLRALLDHVPPIFRCKNFDEVANNYPWSRTDKGYMRTLRDFRNQADDVLHRHIRRTPDLIKMHDLPSRSPVNALLEGCLNKL